MYKERLFTSINKLIGAILMDYIENDWEDIPTIESFKRLKVALEKSPYLEINNSSYYIPFYQWNIRKDNKNRYHLYQGEL